MVDDHFQQPPKQEQEIIAEKEEDDNFNDRVQEDMVDFPGLDLEEQPVEVKVEIDDDEDNILRKPIKDLEFQDIEEMIEDKSDEQESIEIINNHEEVEKKQDYALMNKLLSFLDTNSKGHDDAGLNLTLSGYFCKVVEAMLKTAPKELMKYIVNTEYVIFDKMLNHIDNKSVCELIILITDKLLT